MPLRFGPFTIDAATHALTRDGVDVPVQPKVFDLLWLLASEPGVLHPRESLARRLWPGVHVTEDSLHQLFRKARIALGDRAEGPPYIEAVPRRGWRFVAPVTQTRAGAEPHTIALRSAVDAFRCVLVHGPPGIGKSHLVREALANRPATRWVDCQPARDEGGLVASLARCLDVPLETAAASAAERLGRALAARGAAVVVLDGADGVVEPLSRLLPTWLAAAPEARVVVTSRRQGELAPDQLVGVAPLPPEAARALLGGLVGHDELVDRLGGVPLALVLAARRLRLLSPEELLARLDRSPSVLADAAGHSLAGAIGASWTPLSPAERRVLGAASVPSSAFDLRAVEELVEGEDVLAAIDRLVDASLVQAEAGKLSVLRPVRDFVRAAAPDVDAELGRRWIAHLVRRAESHLPAFFRWERSAIVALTAMAPDLQVAWRRAVERPAVLAVCLAASLRYGGPWWVAREALEAVADPDGLTTAMLGEFRIRTGDPLGGLDALERAASEESAMVRAYAGFLRARVLRAMGRVDEARSVAEAAIGDAAGNPGLTALAHDSAALAEADPAAAAAHYAAALAAAAGPEHATLRGLVGVNYGAWLGHAGQHAAALLQFAAAHDDLRHSPLLLLRSVALGNVGLAMAEAGEVRAEGPLADAVQLARQMGDRDSESQFGARLGEVRLWRGDLEGARELFERARTLGVRPGLERRHRALLALAERNESLAVGWAAEAATLGDAGAEQAMTRLRHALNKH